MAWRREFSQTAAFRGVEFFYTSRERTAGRRGTTDEFAGRNVPSGQDFGRKRKVFSVPGFVVGDDYLAQADAIEAACDADGPGPYRDPDGKVWTVICRSCKRVEAIKEKGLARFSLQFEEAGGDSIQVRVDTSAQLLKAADRLDQASLEMFAEEFKTDGLPDFVYDSAALMANEFGHALKKVGQSLPQLIDTENPYIQSIAGGVQTFTQYASDGINSELGAQVVSGISTIAKGAYTKFGEGVPSIVADGLISFAGQSFGVDEGVLTPQRQQQRNNGFVFDTLTKASCLSETVRAVCVETFDSVDAGLVREGQVLDLIDGIQRDVSGDGSVRFFNDAVYSAATEVGLQLTKHIQAKTGGLPRIVRKATGVAIPAVVAAFEQYGDASRVGDLERRNSTWTEPLLPADEELEWLSS